MTVVTTSCVAAGAPPWLFGTAAELFQDWLGVLPSLLGTAGEFPPDWLGGGVGFAVHLVQIVIMLVLNTVEVVKPVVTIWLPPDKMVEVNGQTVV